MSQPAAVSSAICCNVVLTSCVLVVHIDCTEIGWSLPTPTSRTINWRVLRRGASVGAGPSGMPRPTVICAAPPHRFVPRKREVPPLHRRRRGSLFAFSLLEELDRIDQIGGHRE